MPEAVEFEEWWKDWERKFRQTRSGGRSEIDDLHKTIKAWPPHKQQALINELFDHAKHEIANALVAEFGNEDQKLKVREIARKYMDDQQSKRFVYNFIHTILKTYTPKDVELLEEYFLERQNEEGFSSVPYELFEAKPELFLKAYKKYLPSIKSKALYYSDGTLHMAAKPEALEYLIKHMPWWQARRLKKFASFKSKNSLLSEDKREKLKALSQL